VTRAIILKGDVQGSRFEVQGSKFDARCSSRFFRIVPRA